jgi:D-alanyl-D-alanine carboxypeptidase (penicillin-binding protein 5/6)
MSPARSLAAALAVVATFVPAGPAAAAVTTLGGPTDVVLPAPREPRGLDAKAGVLIDAETGRVLWSRSRNDVRPIASTTKLMTALVALSRAQPGEVLTATRYPAKPGESLIGLRAGERMTVRDLVTGLLLASGNDAADTLATRLASSKGAFVAAMNRRARALGLRRTRFGNAVGLDQPRTVSTAAELAELSRAAMRNRTIARTVGRARARLRSGARARTVVNRNELVGRYGFVDGIKTGHTMKAGYVLVGAASRLDADVISVVLGEPSIAARNRDTLALLRYGRAHFKPLTAVRKGKTAITLQTTPGDNPVPLVPRRTLRLAARDGESVKVVASTRDDVRGPLERGTRLGTVWVERDGRRVDETALVTASAVAEPTAVEWLGYVLGRSLPLLIVPLLGFMMVGVLLWRRARSLGPLDEGTRVGTRAAEL